MTLCWLELFQPLGILFKNTLPGKSLLRALKCSLLIEDAPSGASASGTLDCCRRRQPV